MKIEDSYAAQIVAQEYAIDMDDAWAIVDGLNECEVTLSSDLIRFSRLHDSLEEALDCYGFKDEDELSDSYFVIFLPSDRVLVID